MLDDEAEAQDVPREQLIVSANSPRLFTPEHRLLCAIVNQTFRDLFSSHNARKIEARNWFLTRDKSWPFYFSTICEYLNVSPKNLRRYARHITPPTRRVQRHHQRAA
jgi:hypothetical protein